MLIDNYFFSSLQMLKFSEFFIMVHCEKVLQSHFLSPLTHSKKLPRSICLNHSNVSSSKNVLARTNSLDGHSEVISVHCFSHSNVHWVSRVIAISSLLRTASLSNYISLDFDFVLPVFKLSFLFQNLPFKQCNLLLHLKNLSFHLASWSFPLRHFKSLNLRSSRLNLLLETLDRLSS